MKLTSILLTSIMFAITSCSNHQRDLPLISNGEIIIDSLPGECPYLTSDNKGNTVLSWARIVNDSTTAFCYAILKNGISFGAPVIVPATGNIEPHGENLPKIIFKPSGSIMCLWGVANPNENNKYSGLVYYVASSDDGKTWTNPTPLTRDTGSYDQRYYDVALLPNGEVGITWLDNRKTGRLEGSGLYFASTDRSNKFVGEKLISEPCCQCCRTDLFVEKNGYIHALYRGIIQDSIRDMMHIVSKDGGNTFSKPNRLNNDNWVINGCPHTGPTMSETNNALQFAWYTGGKNKGCYYSYSTDNGSTFVPGTAVSEFGSHPQITSLKDNDVLLVWDETVKTNRQLYKRIGIQARNEVRSTAKQFLTPADKIATYPVIKSLDGTRAIVAYTIRRENKNYVNYQVVNYQQ